MTLLQRLIFLIAIWLALSPWMAQGQDTGLYGQRLQGRYGWLTPVASRHLTSTAHDHVNRGSVPAYDITAPYGSGIYPIAPGAIEYAGCSNAGGYGCWVIVNHGNGYRSYYAHMISGSIRVQRGQRVGVDTLLGQVGRTGMTSFGPHVHLEINGPNGRIDPANIWPQGAFTYQKLGDARSNKPVGSNGYITISATGEVQQAGPRWNLGWLPYALVGLAVFYAVYSPQGSLARGAYHGTALALIVLLLVYWPVLVALQAPRIEQDGIAGGTKWDIAYKITRRWEGSDTAPCVRDPVLTRFGVTQGTYNSYLASRGRVSKSVCAITQVEVKTIYYQRYWLASGADKLPLKLAITHFDFAINAGVGAAAKALGASGGSPRLYNDYRIAFYQSASLCRIFCRAWLNRVADVRQYTE